ncbi:4-deoxy-L-threo-5-hexosulose-uronate ketol-isomerase (EC [Olavius sp. associated proteobacterium Delta 1]|nr:4-deoxy-L-threo-5-hexosulose-uronate ketol-isomerase (EC [Olavius sp. associated proteobacterium Delta 1]
MDMRESSHPNEFKSYSTDRIRQEFLIQDLFKPGEIKLVYSFYDRMIAGGICPDRALTLEPHKDLGTDYFLERREMGIINVGSPGTVTTDGQEYVLNRTDGLYIGRGVKDVVFSSADKARPAHFYVLSAPAHQHYPTVKIEIGQTETVELGVPEEANVRTLHKYIHPDGAQSCQLCMGMTKIAPHSVWNSMPCHTHGRRMEVYFYFDLPENTVMFHLMGKPDETRHIVIRNEEAVISPNWSIHAGAGTSNYAFIWGMIGENQIFSDMDAVDMGELQ